MNDVLLIKKYMEEICVGEECEKGYYFILKKCKDAEKLRQE